MTSLDVPENLSVRDLQNHVDAFCRHFKWDRISNEKTFLLFIEEVGELAKALRKVDALAEEKVNSPLSDEDHRKNLEEEFADVLS